MNDVRGEPAGVGPGRTDRPACWP